MGVEENGHSFECVVVDLNTQHDFCDRSGRRRVANFVELIPALRDVIAWTKRYETPVISSVESHRADEMKGPHPDIGCIDGSRGQQKIDFTLFDDHERIEVDNTLVCSADLFSRCQQVIFRKRGEDLLCNPKADRLFNVLRTQEFVLFGVAIERSIKALALGLLAREKPVTIVVDACGFWSEATADLTLRQLTAKGARLITTEQLKARKLQRHRRFASSRRMEQAAGNGNGRNGRARHNGSQVRNGAPPRERYSPQQ